MHQCLELSIRRDRIFYICLCCKQSATCNLFQIVKLLIHDMRQCFRYESLYASRTCRALSTHCFISVLYDNCERWLVQLLQYKQTDKINISDNDKTKRLVSSAYVQRTLLIDNVCADHFAYSFLYNSCSFPQSARRQEVCFEIKHNKNCLIYFKNMFEFNWW